MRQKHYEALSAKIEEAQKRVEYWRATRTRRSPMPEELWALAVELARAHGVWPVVRALRLNYVALKQRLEKTVRTDLAIVPAGGTARFVELSAPQLFSPTAQPALVLTLSDGAGACLELRLRESIAVDVAGLAASWRSQRR